MNDRFKFRAWDQVERNMVRGFYLRQDGTTWFESEEDGQLCKDNPPLVLMQYTGLKDKNGKLIYEGDIVFWFKQSGVVEYSNANFAAGYQVSGRIGFWYDCEGQRFPWNEVEVIGNLYENSELLEVKQND